MFDDLDWPHKLIQSINNISTSFDVLGILNIHKKLGTKMIRCPITVNFLWQLNSVRLAEDSYARFN